MREKVVNPEEHQENGGKFKEEKGNHQRSISEV